MDLFNAYYNSETQFLLDLFSLNRDFTEEEACVIARQKHTYAPYNDLKETVRKWVDKGILLPAEDGKLKINDERGLRPFAAPLNQIESEYLSNICGTEEAKLFLKERPAAVPSEKADAPLRYIKRQNSAGRKKELETVDPEVFRAILQAIYRRERIEDTFRTNQDPTPREAVVIPYRIEYGVYDGRWWLIAYNEEEKRTIKVKLENILAVRPAGRHTVPEEEIRQAIYRQLEPEPAVLHIIDRKNALERCFLLFESMLDMTAYQLGGEEYELHFRFFRWDRNIIVRNLLYLGENVTLKSPASLIEDLRTELRRALAL